MDDFASLEVYRTRSLRRSEKWRWRLRHQNSRIIAESGEGYANQVDAREQAIKVVSGHYWQQQ